MAGSSNLLGKGKLKPASRFNPTQQRHSMLNIDFDIAPLLGVRTTCRLDTRADVT
jgi:hypothetical protein